MVKSVNKLQTQSHQLHQVRKMEIITEDYLDNFSAEALATQRLGYLDNPSQLVTVIDADQEIEEESLQEWVVRESEKRQIKCI